MAQNNKITIIIDATTRAAQAGIDAVSKSMAGLTGAIEKQTTAAGDMSKRLDDMAGKFGSIGAKAAIATAALATPLAGIVKATAQWEQYEVAITNMMGSSTKAKALLSDLATFAAKTPFEITGVVSSAKQLMAYGVEAQNIIPTLTMVGNAAAKVGVPVEQLALAYGQVIAKGKLTGEELRQLTGAGINMGAAFEKSTGIARESFAKMVEQGKINSDIFQKIMADMFLSSGEMATQSKTLAGQFSNFKDNVGQLAISMGNALLPTLKSLNGVLLNVTEYIRNLSPETKAFMAWALGIATVLVGSVAAFSLITAGVLSFGAALLKLGPAINGVAVALKFLATTPIGLTITGITAAFLALNYALDKLGLTWGATIGLMVSYTKSLWTNVSTIFPNILDQIKIVINNIADIFGKNADIVAKENAELNLSLIHI